MVAATAALACLGLLVLGHASSPQPAGHGFALIVGVAKFPPDWGDAPACVNDAVAVAKVLAQQDYYKGRIRLIALGVPEGSLGQIEGVQVQYTLPNDETSVRDALADLGEAAGRDDFVLCYITTHGTVENGKLRLLLPNYEENAEHSYMEFDKLVDELRREDAQVAYVINACESAGGSLQGAGADYLEKLFREYKVARFVLTACQEKEQSHVDLDGQRTIFGEVFEAEIGAGSKPIVMEQLSATVQEEVPQRRSDQHPFKNRWALNDPRSAIVSKPKESGAPEEPINWLAAVATVGEGEILAQPDRDDALRVLARYAADVGAAGDDALTAEEVKAVLDLKASTPEGDTLKAWEKERYGAGLSEEEQRTRRKAWVQAIKAYAGETPAPTAETYYAKLASAGLPPVIRLLPFDSSEDVESVPIIEPEPPPACDLALGLKTAPDGQPPPGGVQAWQEGQLELLTSADDPQIDCEPTQTARVTTAQVRLTPWLPGLTRAGFITSIQQVHKRKPGATTVLLEAPESQLQVTVTDKGSNLASSPRTVTVKCPADLTVTEPANEIVTEPTVTVSGRVWCQSGSPTVEVDGQAATLEGPTEEVYSWTAADIDLKLPEEGGEKELAIKGLDGSGGVIGEIALKVNYIPFRIDPPLIAGLVWRMTQDARPEAEPSVPLEAYDKATGIVVALGEGDVKQHTIKVADAKTRPADRVKVNVEVEGGLQAGDLRADPVNVPLAKLKRFEGETAKLDAQPWELAPGTWKIALNDDPKADPKLSDTWKIGVEGGGGEAGSEKTLKADAQVKVKAARHADCSISIATDPGDMAATMTLHGTWDGAPPPQTVQIGPVGNLTAGDYELEIDDTPNEKRQVNTGRIQAEKKLTLVEGKAKSTVLVRVTRNPGAVVIPFRLRLPPCKLPIPITVASYMTIGGERIPVPPTGGGPHEVSLDRKLTSGEVALFTEDGNLEYYRGQIQTKGDDREIVPLPEGGALTGTFEMSGRLDKLSNVQLEAVSVPGPDSPEKPLTQDQWSKAPVGKYRFTGQLELPGLEAIPIARDVTVPGSKPELKDLLADLPAKVQEALGKHEYDVEVTVQHLRVVSGSAPETLANPAVEVLLEPAKLATEGGAQTLRDVGAPQAAVNLLEGYTPPAPTVEGDKIRFSGLREGSYTVKVSGPPTTTYTPKSVEVPTAGNALAVRLESRFASLPFKPDQPEGWTVELGGVSKPLGSGAELPVDTPDESGDLVVKQGDTAVWHGHLENGVATAKPDAQTDEKGFVLGDLTLEGALVGMSGQLTPVKDAVPYLRTDQGAQYAGSGPTACEAGQTAIKWRVPLGKYTVAIGGFEPLEVSIPETATLRAAELKAQEATLQVTFQGPVAAGDVQSCTVTAPEDAPYFKLDPGKRPREFNLKEAGWSQSLPHGSYNLKAVWKQGGGARLWERAIELPNDSALTFGEGGETADLLMVVEIRGARKYQAAPRDPDARDPWVWRTTNLDPGDTIQLIPNEAGAKPIDLKTPFTEQVPPGAYQIKLTTHALGLDGKSQGDARDCSTEAGALKVPVPEAEGWRYVVVVECTVPKAAPSPVLEIKDEKPQPPPPKKP